MNCYEKLLAFLSIKKLEGSSRIEFPLSDFPCLKEYAQHLIEKAISFKYSNEDEVLHFIPYSSIIAVDPFWKDIFGDAGFHYDLATNMFVFATCDIEETSDFKNPLPFAIDKAFHFVKELRKRGYL